EHGVPGIYRTQNNGKVKMSTVAAPHQGLGVAQYMWSSSPLRRYVDMVNQRQIIAMLDDAEPIYPKNDTGLYTVLRDFETMYGIYNDFQRQMERYWCLRYIQQEKLEEISGTVIRENLVRLANIPLVFKAHSMPEQPAGTKVVLGVGDIDLIDLNLHTRFISAEAPIVIAPPVTEEAA
ncbi:MAG: RNB domain-containing ribonuclease, partial [Gallionella sp.]